MPCPFEISCREFFADPANDAYVRALLGDTEELAPGLWEREPDVSRLSAAFHAMRGNPDHALAELRALADAGSPMSMLYLGYMFAEGIGVPVDLKGAETWYRRAHDNHAPSALCRLGGVLERMGNFDAAEEVFSTGIAAGDRLCIHHLGYLYMQAAFPRRDLNKARGLLAQAASNGNFIAARDLAYLLIKGHFGLLNRIRGVWMLLAWTPKAISRLAAVPDVLTSSERDVLHKQLQSVWNRVFPESVPHDVRFEIVVALNRDGGVRQAWVANPKRLADPGFRAMTDAALQAIRSPGSQPFKLPPKKYERWRTMVLRFTQGPISEAS